MDKGKAMKQEKEQASAKEKRFKEYVKFYLPDVDKWALTKWTLEDTFRRSIAGREGSRSFTFYEGPPSANGRPGIHHVIARTLKDLFCRYRTMKGYRVERKGGWDTHGLPVELEVEKALGITKDNIGRTISVADYNAACRKAVTRYTKEWSVLTQRMGYWIDLQNAYITCDNRYIESLWHLLKRLYDKGLLYKGYTIQPYSPAAGTGLSAHELNQPGAYRPVRDTAVTVQFKILSPSPIAEMEGHGGAFFLAWTTTPWTLPSNTALCVGAEIVYAGVQTFNPYTGKAITVVLAKDLLWRYFSPRAGEMALEDYRKGDRIPYKVVGEWKGSELVGMRYEQLFPWVNVGEGGCRVIAGEFVTTEEGTGIVHIAPTFGADDDKVARANGVPPLMLTDKEGNQRPMVDPTGKYYRLEDLDASFVQSQMNALLYAPYAGKYVKNAYDPAPAVNAETLDMRLCQVLKSHDRAFRIEKHEHTYPHCWRTDKPVLYYPMDSWFIRTTACRDRLIALNETIAWKPASLGSGRFGKWLENLQDWNLSRSRFWGTPLPVWRTEDGSEEICIGSMEELCREIDKSVEAGVMSDNPYKRFQPGVYTKENYDRIDLHRPYVDEIILLSASGKAMRRESDLIDVWFDSGAMPYAQIHYPFENKSALDNGRVYPADFIAEGVDQTRGWFFTLHALSVMAFDSVAFKTVVSNGLVLDKAGNKMSKRLGNAIDPFAAIERYGADPLRWYMITNASPWDNIKFDWEGLEEVSRKFFGTLYHTYAFFALYANVDGFDPSQPPVSHAECPEIDRWIISLLHSLVKETDSHYEQYEPTRAGRAIAEFTDDLSNWYVRLNRSRFWKGGMTADKLSAYQTLYSCLTTVAKLMAPLAPFYSERLFCDLSPADGEGKAVSVHLADFPVCRDEWIDKDLEERMKLAQAVSSMALALRRKASIKVRQPLQTILIPAIDAKQRESIEAVKGLILHEVNVKELTFADGSADMLVKKVKPDYKQLGPRYGKIMQSLAAAIQDMTQEEIAGFESAGRFTFHIAEQTAVVNLEDVEILSEDIPGWSVATEGRLTVALDLTLTDALRKEGLARELVNRLQNLRKSSGFDITDKVNIRFLSSDAMNDAIAEHKEYIMHQVLADTLQVVDTLNDPTLLDFENFSLSIRVDKA